VLEIQNLVLSDVETDIDRDNYGHHDYDTGSRSLDDYEQMETVMDVIDSVASRNGIIQENTTGFYSYEDGNVWSDIALFSSCTGREQRRYYPSHKRDSVPSQHYRSGVHITPLSREVQGTVMIPIYISAVWTIRRHSTAYGERGYGM